MKRILCILLCLLIPVLSLAEVNESAVIGTWISTNNDYSSGEFVRVVVFYENHRAYYSLQSFFSQGHLNNKPVTQYLCTWEINGNQIILKDVDSTYSFDLYLVEDNCISYIPTKSGALFYKVSEQKATDLSSLSHDELVQLEEDVRSEIFSRSQWGSVTVPPGFYVVGEDIPAGHWTIRYAPGELSYLEYFLKTDATGKEPADLFHDYYSEGVCDPENSLSSVYKLTEIDLDLKEGYHLVISNGSVIFEPFTGRPSPFK